MVNKYSCVNCYYHEDCTRKYVCDDYFPYIEEFEEELASDIIESEKEEYIKAWNDIEEYGWNNF